MHKCIFTQIYVYARIYVRTIKNAYLRTKLFASTYRLEAINYKSKVYTYCSLALFSHSWASAIFFSLTLIFYPNYFSQPKMHNF